MISLDTKLAILQQSEYEWPRYTRWLEVNKNAAVRVQPKQWTLKLQLLKYLSFVFSLHGALLLLEIPKRLVIAVQVWRATQKLRRLQSRGLIVIAIAGSYAKTSTKYIAQHVLSGSKKVVMTPENINTPIGIARFILDHMNGNEEVFIAELGEYYPGDIAGLVRFLSPDYKILTPIGYAHLERFGTKEKLHDGLMELITTQPSKGKAFVFGRDYDVSRLSQVSVTRAGTEFVYEDQPYFIPLFGAHNAVNVLPALWLAKELHIDVTTAKSRVSSLSYIPHRLEPTQLEHNILMLDNGYNSNPASARESLAVLKALDASQKIVCTPGFIELGEIQTQENEKLGEEISKVADLCIVINGVNTQAIVSGLKKGSFTDDQIIIASGEEEGMNLVSKLTKHSAIILFENSIPELYKKSA